MDQDTNIIAKRIKDLRLLSEMTEKDVATAIGISLSEYKDYESGKDEIPAGILYNIAAELRVDPTLLLTGEAEESTNAGRAHIVYGGEGVKIQRHPGYAFTSLAAGVGGRLMEPMIVAIKEGVAPELLHHSGQEFNYVLEGKLRVLIGIKEYYLRTGDSIYFDPAVPHSQVAMGGDAKFLTVILEK